MSEKMSHLEDENSRLQADVEVFKNNIAILVITLLFSFGGYLCFAFRKVMCIYKLCSAI